ncbi:MAG: hypothetical protein OXI95_12415 [bacterium]|nr:hypothetical protein [bacterium]
MTVMLGDIRLDRIEESSDIGNVPHLDFPDATPEALAPYLGWLVPAAIDSGMAAANRRRILEQLTDSGVLVLTQHFPAPSAGQVFSARTGIGFRHLEGGMAMGEELHR